MADIEQGSAAPKQPSTKLEIVRSEIKQNPAVSYVGEISSFYRGGGWTQCVDMIVAPVKPEFDADALNELMLGLVKGVKATSHDHFYSSSNGLRLGKLYYDEAIGLVVREVNTTVTAYDLEAMQAGHIELHPTNPSIEEEELMRRTWLRIYPDITSAIAMYQYETGNKVDSNILDELDISQCKFDMPRSCIEKLKAHYANPIFRFRKILDNR